MHWCSEFFFCNLLNIFCYIECPRNSSPCNPSFFVYFHFPFLRSGHFGNFDCDVISENQKISLRNLRLHVKIDECACAFWVKRKVAKFAKMQSFLALIIFWRILMFTPFDELSSVNTSQHFPERSGLYCLICIQQRQFPQKPAISSFSR